jgi:hypothetical protein
MSVILSRALLFAAGFALWTAFSFAAAQGGGIAIREGWDAALYWKAGVPLLIIAQLLIAKGSPERIWRQPLWILAGHIGAMVLVHPAGTGLSLAPLAAAFIGVPGYLVLILTAALGRRFAPLH